MGWRCHTGRNELSLSLPMETTEPDSVTATRDVPASLSGDLGSLTCTIKASFRIHLKYPSTWSVDGTPETAGEPRSVRYARFAWFAVMLVGLSGAR